MRSSPRAARDGTSRDGAAPRNTDVLVIGAGLAGLSAARQAAAAGAPIAKGWGAQYWPAAASASSAITR